MNDHPHPHPHSHVDSSKLQISTKEVLKKPQHYHAEVFCYENENSETHNFDYSTSFELVGNDIELIKSRALTLAEPNQKKVFVKTVRQCSDPTHLEGLEE